VLTALAKNPEDRYQSADELLAALDMVAPIAAEARASDVTETVTVPIETPRRRATPGSAPRAPRTPVGRRSPGTGIPAREAAGRRPSGSRTPAPTPTARTLVLAPSDRAERLAGWLRARRVLIAFVVVAVAGAAIWLRTSGSVSQRFSSVAVLPFHNVSSDVEATNYLADGITESLIAKLTQVSDLRVTPWITSARFAESTQSLEEIAGELNVDALIVGTFRSLGDQIQGTVSLVDAKTGFQYWADEFEEPVADLFEVQRKIALGAAMNLRGKLSGQEQQQLARPPAQSVAAYEFYLKGASELQAGNEDGANSALAYFHKAVEIDSTLAEAYVGIGAVYSDRYFYGWEGGLQSLKNAEENYQHALALAPDMMVARRGLIRIGLEKGPLRSGILEHGRIIAESGRQDVEALLVWAEAYVLGGLPQKGIPILEQIIQLDPANIAAHWFLVIADAWDGRNEEAIRDGETFLKKFGDDGEVYLWMSVAAASLGRSDQAEDYYHRSEATFGDTADDRHLFIFSTFLIDLGKQDVFRANVERSLRVINEKLDAFPDNGRLLTGRAVAHAYLGDGRHDARAANARGHDPG
jgi:TolB-like protein